MIGKIKKHQFNPKKFLKMDLMVNILLMFFLLLILLNNNWILEYNRYLSNTQNIQDIEYIINNNPNSINPKLFNNIKRINIKKINSISDIQKLNIPDSVKIKFEKGFNDLKQDKINKINQYINNEYYLLISKNKEIIFLKSISEHSKAYSFLKDISFWLKIIEFIFIILGLVHILMQYIILKNLDNSCNVCKFNPQSKKFDPDKMKVNIEKKINNKKL